MAREIASSWEGRTSRPLRKKIEMLFAHLKRILKLDRLRLRGPNGARDEFTLAATAQNLRKMAKLIPMLTASSCSTASALAPIHRITAAFFNGIGQSRLCWPSRNSGNVRCALEAEVK
jgi:hypothetical protein